MDYKQFSISTVLTEAQKKKKKKNQRSFSCLTNYSSTSVLLISSFELRGPVSGQKVPIARVSVHCLVWLIILKSH